MGKSKKVLIVKQADTVSLQFQRWHLIVIAISLIALVTGGVVLGMYLVPQTEIDRDAVDYPWTPPDGSGNAEEIALPGYEKILFPANTQKVGILLPNPTGNPCHFRFTMILSDTGEILYRSGLIPPGMAVTEITLARALEVGNYKLTIQIEATAVNGGTPMNGSNMQVDLEVR